MQKNRSKKLLVLALAIAVSFPLTANAANNAAAKTQKVIFWQQQFEPYQQTWFKKYVDKFNASQKAVKVELYVVPGDVWIQKLKTAQAAGKNPDVATTNYGNIAPGVANGQFSALDGLLPASAFTDIKSNVKSFVTIGGKHYAYPMLVEPSTVLYYRTDLVLAAGLDPRKPPKTWAELIDWAKKLTTPTVKGMTIASTAPDLGWSSWGLQYNACGSLPISDDWATAAATKPCYTKLLDFYKTLYQDGLIPQTPKVGYADGAPYGQGDVAMMAGGSWVIGQLKNTFPTMIAKTTVSPFPSWDGDAKKPTATLGGWTLTLDSKSKVKPAAASFINYLLAGNAAVMADFFKAASYSKYTVRTSVDTALAKTPSATDDPFMKIISDKIVKYGKQEPAYPWDINLAMGAAIESAMKNVADVPTALKKANDAINEIIKKQALAGTNPRK